jgi:transcriptional regulator with XRE-family HTH domain
VLTGSVGSLEFIVELGRLREVRSAMGWAQVRALAADGLSPTQIAARLGINRRTVKP